MKGDIIIYRPTGIIGKLIQFISKDEFIHVAMFISNDKIIEATWRGIEISKFKLDKGIEIYSYTMDEYKRELLIQTAISKKNKKYDYPLLFTIMGEKWFKLRAYDSKEAFICSEFIRDVYNEIGIEIHEKNNPTPQELRDNLFKLAKDITSDVSIFSYSKVIV